MVTIKPGDKETKSEVGEGTARSTVTSQDAILDLIRLRIVLPKFIFINFEYRNLFPENLIQATIQQGQTYYTYEKSNSIVKSNSSVLINENDKKKWHFKYNDNTNILGVIAFCVAFGMIISSMGRKAEILLHLFLVLNEITMKFVKIIMW